jgi:hypothetical protein
MGVAQMVDKFKAALGHSPKTLRLLALAPVALLVAGCAQVGTNNITFWDIVWSISIFFLWLIFIWMFVALFVDVIRRRDLGGWKKAGWIIFMLILPFLGILLYIAFRPAEAGEQWAMGANSYGYSGVAAAPAGAGASGGGSTVDELTRLQSLRASGAITDAEFEQLKKNVMA